MKKNFSKLLNYSGLIGLVAFVATKIAGASFFAAFGVASCVGLVVYAAIAHSMTGKFLPSSDDFNKNKDGVEPELQISKSKSHEKQVEPISDLAEQYNNKSETHFRDMVSGQKDNSNRHR